MTTFAWLTTRILRKWQAKRGLAAFVLVSHGKHTEASLLRDDSGSAYQITLHAAGLHFCSRLTVSEYVPETMRILNQYSLRSSVLTLRRDLERSLDQVYAWMKENKAQRLPLEEELKLVEAMFEKSAK